MAFPGDTTDPWVASLRSHCLPGRLWEEEPKGSSGRGKTSSLTKSEPYALFRTGHPLSLDHRVPWFQTSPHQPHTYHSKPLLLKTPPQKPKVTFTLILSCLLGPTSQVEKLRPRICSDMAEKKE